jgi:hypothetical protein
LSPQKIHHFSEVEGEGKPWQLRSVKVGNNWFILPFVVGSGGLSWNLPIISFQAMKKIGLGHVDKSLLNPEEKHDYLLEMPTPLGIIHTPLFSNWEFDKKQKLAFDDIRFNLVGHELAAILIEINLLASVGNLSEENKNQRITQILQNHSTISSLNFEAIEKRDRCNTCQHGKWKTMD